MQATKMQSLVIFWMLIGLSWCNLRCLDHVCQPNHHENPVCILNVWHGQLYGECHHSFHHSPSCQSMKYLVPEGRSCGCVNEACVQNVINAFHQDDFKCLRHTCHRNQVCILYRASNNATGSLEIHSECIRKPDTIHQCVDYHSMTVENGCHCQSENCVTQIQKIFNEHPIPKQDSNLRCLNRICNNNYPVCEIRKEQHHEHMEIYGSCQIRHVRLCEDRFYLRKTYMACRCLTQDCINTVLNRIQHKDLFCSIDHGQGMQVNVVNGISKITCQRDPHRLLPCDEPFIPGISHQPCVCYTQHCADNIHEHGQTSLGFTSQPHSNHLQCIQSTCSQDKPICELEKHNSNLVGSCHHKTALHPCEDYHYLSGSHSTCSCTTAQCISNVVQNSRHNYSGYLCLDHLCFSNQLCHLFTAQINEQAQIVMSNCVSKPDPPAFCTKHDSIYQKNGCYCNSTRCINNIGINYRSLICPVTQGVKISLLHSDFTAHCQEGSHNLPTCDQPFRKGASRQPCFCATQHCVDNLQYHATTTEPKATQPHTSPHVLTTIVETKLPTTEPKTWIPPQPPHTTLETTPPTTQPPKTTLETTPPTTPVITTKAKTSPMTTGTTMYTTTEQNQNTAPKAICNVCGDSDFGIPCRAQALHEDIKVACEEGYNYCMTDVTQDARGNIDVFKRCVNQATCDQKWTVESSNNTYCTNFGIGKYATPFECHFCCTGVGCNTNIMPERASWYTSGQK